MSRERESFIRDPAVAIAAAKCLLARQFPPGTGLKLSAFHPEECAFEEMETPYLMSKVLEFNTWAGMYEASNYEYDPDKPPMAELQPRIEAWNRLPDAEQTRLVREAQGYDA